MTDKSIDCQKSIDSVPKEKSEIHAMKKLDDYGRIYGRSRNLQKYQTSCKRLSRRKWRINKR